MRGRVKAFRAPKCAYPLTAVRCVSRVYTLYGVFVRSDHGIVSRENRSERSCPTAEDHLAGCLYSHLSGWGR
jgi:hypothetical protein